MPYIIMSDSGCSLTKEEINESGLKILNLSFILKGKEYFPDSSDDIKLFYNELRKKESASTSCINVVGFIKEFEKELIKGNDIISVSLSSGLSSTYENSVIAKNKILEKYPDRKIVCIDSLLASYGTGMLLYNAGILQKEGKSFEEVVSYLEKYKLKATALFTVDDLFYLYRGGRVKQSSYFLAKAIHIKPLLHVDDKGKLVAIGKVLGRKRALINLVEKMVNTIENPEDQIVYIGHGDCLDDVSYVIDLINKKIKVKGFKIAYIDPVIGVHSGPGTFALFYYAKKRI